MSETLPKRFFLISFLLILISIPILNLASVSADEEDEPLAASAQVTKIESVRLGGGMMATKRDAVAGGLPAQPGDTISYTVYITNGLAFSGTNVIFSDTIDPNTTLVPASLNVSPLAFDDTYTAVSGAPFFQGHNIVQGGAMITTTAVTGITANDTEFLGDTFFLTPFSTATSNGGGSVVVAADGSFVFTPTPSFSGVTTFTYTIFDGAGLTGDGLVTINVGRTLTRDGINPILVTHAQQGHPGANTGTYEDPFPILTPSTHDIIHIHADGTHTGESVVLAANQRLLGESSSCTHLVTTFELGVIPLPTATGGTNAPILSNAPGDTVTANNNTEINCLTINNPTGAGIDLTGLTGTVDVANTTITGGTNGVDIQAGSGTFTFAPTVSLNNTSGTTFNLNGGTAAVNYQGNLAQNGNASTVAVTGGHSGGTVTFQTGTINATNGDGLQFDNADGTYTFNSDITLNGGDAGIDIVNGSGGTFTFANTRITNPTNAGVAILNNPGGAVTFTSLDITNSGNTGFRADATDTVQVTGAVTTTNGLGVHITNVGTNLTANFNQVMVNNGTGGGVHLQNNIGTTHFNALAVTSTNAQGLLAVNAGTLTVATGSINTSGHSALELNGTTVGGAGVTFTTVTANSSGANAGVNIDNVGGGTLAVSGTTTVNTTTGGAAGIDIATSGATFNFAAINLDNTNGAGVFLNGNNGPVVMSSGDISTAAGVSFDVNQGAAAVTYGGTINNSANRSVEVTNRTGGTVAFGGAITDTGQGIFLNSNGGGTINFTGGMDLDTTTNTGLTATGGGTVNVTSGTNTINTTTGTALDVQNTTFNGTFANATVTVGTNNPGVNLVTSPGTKTFNALNVTNTNAIGLHANGAGTLTVLGASNTVNTTGHTAVNLINTTIGGGGVTFLNVNASGGDSGISLNNTGTGNFTVTGSGTTDGSGGTLQNINDRGISLITAQNVAVRNMNLINATLTEDVPTHDPPTTSLTCADEGTAGGTNTGCNAPIYMVNASGVNLTNLTINGSAQHGIVGNNVTNLTILNSDMTNIGDEDKENGVHVINLLGASTFNNFNVDGSDTRNVLIENNQSTADIQVLNSSFNNAVREDGFHLISGSTGGMDATVNIAVTDSSFVHNQAVALKTHAEDNSAINVNITGNSFDGEPTVVGNFGIDIAARDNASINFDVIGTGGNPQVFQPFRSHNINVFVFGGGTAVGRISGNTLNQSDQGAGVRVVTEVTGSSNPSLLVDISNNIMTNIEGVGLAGIHIDAHDANAAHTGVATLHATVANNNITFNGADTAIQVYNTDLNNGLNTTCINPTNNITNGSGGFGPNQFFYGNDPVAGTQSGVAMWTGWNGNPDATWFTVNGNTSTTPGAFADVLGPVANGSCTTVPPFAARMQTAERGIVGQTTAAVAALTRSLTAVSDQTQARMALVPGRYPQMTHAAADTAAQTAVQFTTTAADMAAQLFEGWGVTAAAANQPHMATRPTTAKLADEKLILAAYHRTRTATLAAQAGFGGLLVTIGELPQGKRLIITFQVAVDNPLNAGVDQVCNQGVVMGGNFANVNTDDPDTGTLADPTCTPVDGRPDLQVSKDDAGFQFSPGDTITYTLSYTNAGDQGATNVVINDVVPISTTFNAAVSTPGWSCTGGEPAGTACTFAVGSLPGGGANGSLIFAVDVLNPADGVTLITNTACIADDGSNGPDQNPADNCGSQDTPIASLPPTITAVNTNSPILEDSVIIVTGTFTDPDPLDVFILTIDWGEGTPESFNYPAGSTSFAESHQYLDDNPSGTPSDDYTVNLALSDGANTVLTATIITVDNDIPAASDIVATPIDENGITTLTGLMGDTGTQDTFTLTVDWRDGSPLEVFTYGAGTGAFTETHQYLDDNPSGTPSDSYVIDMVLMDDDTGAEPPNQAVVVVSNVAPILSGVSATTAVDENGVATLTGNIADVGTQDTFTLTVDWGDGTVDTFNYGVGTTAFMETHQYLDDDPSGTPSDTYTVDLTLMDDDTGSDTATASVTVSNVAPVLSGVAMTAVLNENDTATLTGNITDPGTQDTFALTVDWGDGTVDTFNYAAGTTSFAETHPYLDDDPSGTPSDSYTVSLTLTDDDTGSDTGTAAVTVNNVAPVLAGVTATAVLNEDDTAALNGNIVDVGTLDTFTLTVDWGDGSPIDTYVYGIGVTVFTETHQYLDDNPSGTPSDSYTISFAVADDDTGSDSGSTSVTVNNVAPVLAGLTATTIDENDFTSLSGSIVDAGTQDTFTLTVDWGDGAPVETFTYAAGTTTFAETHQYLDDDPSGTPSDNYTIALTLTDDDTGSDTGTVAVTVNNADPVLSGLNATNVDENGFTTLTGAMADVGTQDTFTLTVDWNDGTPADTFVYAAGTTAFTVTHQYLDDDPSGTPSDTYTINVTLTDDDTGSDTGTAAVTVSNVAPVLSGVSATAVLDENDTATLTGSMADVGTQDSFTLMVDWGDGSPVETFTYAAGTTTFTETHPYLDDDPSGTPSDSYTISLTLLDDDTGSDTGSVTVTVNNVAPVLAGVTATTIDENDFTTLSGSIGDPGTQDTFTLTVDWGDGSAVETFIYAAGTTTFAETHPYLDDDPSGTPSDSYTISFAIADDDTGSDSGSISVTVNNVAPVLAGVTATTIDENDFTSLSGSIGDPGTLDTFTLTVDWGDGSPVETFTYAAGTTTFAETHQYLDDDPTGTPWDSYTISLMLLDDDTGSDAGSVTVTVNNVAPVVDGGSDQTVAVNTAVSFAGVFTDVGSLDTHTIVWDFGDGVAVTGTLTPVYTYTSSGVYTATLTITDDDSGVGGDQVVVLVQETGTAVYLPVIFNDHVVLMAPDLVVQSITVSSGDVQIVIENQGNQAVVDPFWVDLYINPDPVPTLPNEVWESVAAEGLVWGVADVSMLTPGGTLTLNLSHPDYDPSLSNFSGTFNSGDVVYVQVDSAHTGTSFGGVLEDHEITGGPYNNISSVTVTGVVILEVFPSSSNPVVSGLVQGWVNQKLGLPPRQ